MRIGNNKTLSPRNHLEVFFHDESCTPSDCTPMRAAIRKRPHPPRSSARERPFRTSFPACFCRSRAAPAPISASGRPCGAAPDDAAAPAGHIPLPACELNNLLPERPAAAAEGGWTALRGALATPDGPLRPPSATDSGSKTGLFSGCCCPGAAPCAVCAHGAGWNGLRGRSRLRRPPPPPRGAPCARRPPSASGAGTHRTPQRCAGVRVAASHPTQANQRNSCSNAFGSFRGIRARMRSEGRAAFLHRFVASLPQKRPAIAIANDFLFFSTASSVVIMVAENPRDFFFVKFQWFIIEPNRYKTAAGSPKTRVTSPTGFFVFSPSRPRRRTETQRNTCCFPR